MRSVALTALILLACTGVQSSAQTTEIASDSNTYAFWRIGIVRGGYTWHHYTIGCAAARKILAQQGGRLEGIAGYLHRTQVPGTTAFYRLIKPFLIGTTPGGIEYYQETQLLTANEREVLEAITRHGYQRLPDQIAGYIGVAPTAGAIDLWRSHNPADLDFFYTTDYAEHRASESAGWSGGSQRDGYVRTGGRFCFPEETVEPPG